MAAGSDDERSQKKISDSFLADVLYDDRSPEEKAAVPVEHRELSRYQVVRESLLLGEYGVPPLPVLVVDKILEEARYWNFVSKHTREYKFIVHESRKPYLSIEVPAECHQVKLVVKEYESQDQGSSSYPKDEGKTVRNSSTCCEVFVLSSEAVEEFKQDPVCTNFQDNDGWEMYREEYGASELLKRLAPGMRVVLALSRNAMLPGWINYVRYAKLTLYFI